MVSSPPPSPSGLFHHISVLLVLSTNPPPVGGHTPGAGAGTPVTAERQGRLAATF